MTWGDHVDIQVGSCIYLSVCLLWSIALHLGGSSPLRAILLLSFSSPRRGTPFIFQVQRALEETAHFEVDFEEAGLWLDGFWT